MSNNMKFAIIFPILAIALIALYGGILGVIFIILNESAMGENSVIILGSALVVLVPVIAYLLEKKTEQSTSA